MYLFKKERKKRMLDGRTITYIAEQIGITSPYLTSILNSKRTCSKTIAFCIVKCLDSENEIADYFDFIEKGE